MKTCSLSLCLGQILFSVLCVVPIMAEATGENEAVNRIVDMQAALEAEDRKTEHSQPELIPAVVPQGYLDDSGKAALKESLRSYYEYRTQGFQHRQRVFEWQLFSSKVIFVVVIFLVVVGTYFSWLQFKADLRRDDGDSNQKTSSTVKASAEGIEVSSPVLGVIILVISLLFFYLYLVHVYPIKEII